ncbi:hypothetical protein [Algoriphagus antarcticus]|uniref:Addiction module component n=1 Tax=Algoriphagus antarcticus TaxID=238540 RepID=A0A3E0DIZ8_9BACT|nr:hypothetical protein [Algoriphagus antarcticus]REG82059.1 hypothetical protein C8N25_12348 [Algoriphagus antarcticus]
MDSIILNPKNEKELKFIIELLGKLGVSNMVMSDEDKEDLRLSFLSAEVDRVEEAPKEEVYKKLTTFLNEKYEFGLTEEDYQVLDERRARHLAGESVSYSWEEVKETAKTLRK